LLKIDADLVVLSSATEPAENTELMRKLNISMDDSGFIKEFHPKIRPTDTVVKNIFVCGAAQGPKDIPDTIAQAGSAASSAAAYLGEGYVWLSPMVANVDASLCRACGRCEEGCEFKAIRVDAAKLCACVEPTLCEGCGKCAVLCPTGAASVHAGSDGQIEALIDGLKLETAI
jgi:heterodisulfide reductase subunit A-like polyferredoxin